MDYDSPLAETLAVLRKISTDYQPAVLANAFGPESMVMTDLIAKHELDIEIFSIDTGRLPEETHALAHSVHRRYGPVIKMVSPDADEVLAWTAQHGQNGFYDAVEHRARLLRRPQGGAAASCPRWQAGVVGRAAAPAVGDPSRPDHVARGTTNTACRSSTRCSSGRPSRCGPTSTTTPSPTTSCTTVATRASGAHRAPVRSHQARTSAPAVGGGSRTPSRSAA